MAIANATECLQMSLVQALFWDIMTTEATNFYECGEGAIYLKNSCGDLVFRGGYCLKGDGVGGNMLDRFIKNPQEWGFSPVLDYPLETGGSLTIHLDFPDSRTESGNYCVIAKKNTGGTTSSVKVQGNEMLHNTQVMGALKSVVKDLGLSSHLGLLQTIA